MASKKAASRSKSSKPAKKIIDALARAMRDSLLPGDTPISEKRLADAAQFAAIPLLGREPGNVAIALASESDGKRMLRIAIVNEDMPFLVDSVAATIAAHGLAIDRLMHPVVAIERDKKGKITSVHADGDDDSDWESVIYLETPRLVARKRRELEKALEATLADVRAAVQDWPRMQDVMASDAELLEDAESTELLTWLKDGMLTLLGHITRKRDGSHSDILGICRKSAKQILADQSYDRAFEWFEAKPAKRNPPRELLIIKANRVANVHRRVPLDLFIVPQRKDGKVTALSIHAGVWTSAALATPPANVPKLRAHLSALMEQLDFDPGGHAGKALVHALTALPHDLVIGFSDKDIARVSTLMMGLVDRPRPRLALVEAPLARHLFAFVWMPRDMLTTHTRLQILEMLESGTGGALLDWSVEVEGSNLAMLRFVLDIRESGTNYDQKALGQRLQTMLRGWTEAVEAELATISESARAAAIATKYADAFPQPYRSQYGAAEAARDIMRLRRMGLHGDVPHSQPHRDVRLYQHGDDPAGHLRLKVYVRRGSLALSDTVPVLENFGYHVIAKNPTLLDDGKLGTINDFTLELPASADPAALLERRDKIEQAIATVLNGGSEDDPFNRLVLGTGLAASEADWLRAFYRYLRQTGMGFTIYTVVDALRGAPAVARSLIALFKARHDPAFDGDREVAAKEARDAIKRGLSKVAAINDDRLLRLYHALIEAILRTNAFAPAGNQALAFKIDSSLVPNLPKPVPWREIFVYSRRVEGIHLRAGPVARGGLRWSDRRDDFRTEILGLMKAQRVKNAVIVPTGAKGGFYPKQLPNPAEDREAWAAEGRESYKVFIRTMLSITDNIVDGKVVHPDNVVITDGEDPYFVVAADKGTATFSDTANAIAESRDFWLDDAFASGGSNGYDHKAMGITAKGAWVSVQRHFLEMGVDVQTDSVRVAGCGDMSGDVFGNGMLLSKAIKLVAAFDHRHIFIDPDPDPAASWKERSRMFALPRSSWEDYNPKLISKGGGVFSRSAKSIKLSKQAREALGVDDAVIEPEALISAIVAAPVDLIWFGGIGTYIRASAENNVQVGDPVNDPVRIDATQVRAKVIGEGANLGVTQAGRIEFALNGGRVNTDFIDNAAGVNCSDNEVNIKIALAAARRSGKLSEKRRNTLLESMTEEVGELVLEDNRLQALALSIAEAGGAPAVSAQVNLIEALESRDALDRQTEGLASGENLVRRASDGHGLTRPELAVLLSSTKLVLQDAIENTGLPDDSSLLDSLVAYFPSPMRKSYKRQVEEHQLRREIIATALANRVINRLGLIHPFELYEEEGVGLADICASFVVAEKLFNMGELWAELDSTAMPEDVRILMFRHAAGALRNHMADLIRAGASTTPPSELIASLEKRVAQLSKGSEDLLTSASRRQSEKLVAEFVEQGAAAKLAAKVAHLYDVDGSVGLAALSRLAEIDARKLTGAFTDLGERIGLDWAQGTSAMMNPSDVWERLLVAGLSRDFQQMRLEFLRRLSRRKGAKSDPLGAVANWAEEHAAAIRQFRAVIGRAQAQAAVTPATLAQIASQARNLLAR